MSPLNERLREVRGAKMVVDVVQFNAATGAAQLRKVVQFVCGNTLVCETIKGARSVAFDGQERLKVHTQIEECPVPILFLENDIKQNMNHLQLFLLYKSSNS